MMQEFRLPKKKQWQTGSESVGKHGPLHGSGAPTFVPEAVGVIYVDIDVPAIYISGGVAVAADWKLIVLD